MENLCGCNIINAEKENAEDDRDDGPFSFTLTDPDVFNCPICYQPLITPVYQCREGHIICSRCSPRISKDGRTNCPSCSRPMGGVQCHAVEKVIEAIKAPCKYREFGCEEALQISNILKHFTSCPFSQFECPLPSCNMAGSYSDWHSHVSRSRTGHMLDAMGFSYNAGFSLTLDKTKRCWILRCYDESKEYGIFVLSNFSCARGNAFTVSRVAPPCCNRPCYDISVSQYGEPSFDTVSLHSSADCIQEKLTNRQPPDKTLFVPDGFDLGGKLFLNVCIKELDAHRCGKNHPEKKLDDRDGPFSFTLTDPDALNCPICYQPLTIPVHQCQKAHIICSPCISRTAKSGQKNCPSCTWPVGEFRCHAIEKVIEAITAPCKYRKFGCKETTQISNSLEHLTSCPLLKFECPLPSCNFSGSYSDWHSHVSQSTTGHMFSVTDFSINGEFQVTLEKTRRCWILRCYDESKEYGIFVLSNFSCAKGNAITVSRVAPAHYNGPCYDISVSQYGEPSFDTVSLHSSADCIQEKVVNRQPPKKTLFVPDGFDLGGKLFLNVRIKELDAHCGKIHLDKQDFKPCGYKHPNSR